MPTIIDSLVVKLGLDSKDLTSKTPEATGKLKDIETASKKAQGAQKPLQTATKDTGKAFTDTAASAGKFLALIGGTLAVKSFISDSIAANVALGNMSANLNTSVASLSSWGNAARMFGGSAADIAGTFQMLSAAQYQLFRGSGEMPAVGRYFAQIGLGVGALQMGKQDQLLAIQRNSLARFGTDGKYSTSQRETAYQAGVAGGIAPSIMTMLLSSTAEELKANMASLKKLAPSEQQTAEQMKLLRTQVLLMAEFRKFGWDMLELLSPLVDSLDDVVKWINGLDKTKRDAVIGGIGVAGAVAGGAAGLSLLSKVGGLLGIGGGAGAAAGGVGAATAGVGAVSAGLVAGAVAVAVSQAARDKWFGIVGPATDAMVKPLFDAGVQASSWFGKMVNKSEGFRSKAYWDVNHYSIGYGTQAHSKDEVIDEAEAQRRRDAMEAAAYKSVDSNVTRTIPARLRDALADLVYNIGGAKFAASKHLLGDVNAGRFREAADDLLQFDKIRKDGKVVSDKGLHARREQERNWALDGIPGAGANAFTPGGAGAGGSIDKSVTIGDVHVHTQATDAKGIAADMKSALDYQFVAQANGALA